MMDIIEFNINLNEKTFEQLLWIAESNGISIDRKYGKEEIIEKILIVERVKRNQEISNEIAKNINPFNKTNRDFKIKESIDEREWSFWKIFRNKFIFRRIMSFLDSHISKSYDSITAVHLMIKNKQFNYLRDKVIRNQHLKFSPHNGTINRNIPDNIGDIFQNFRDDNENDLLFYKKFFKNYNKHILEFNSTEVYKRIDKIIEIVPTHLPCVYKDDREKLVNKIIGKRNLVALKVLIQEYNYIPTLLNLKHSILIGSLKILKFILDPIYNLQNTIHQIEFTINDQIQFKNCIKSLNYLCNQSLLEPILVLKFILKNKNYVVPSISLKTLIIIVQLIDSTISNQNEIEMFLKQVTRNQLKSKLDEKENNKLYSSIIQKMLYVYYRFIHLNQNQLNHSLADENNNAHNTIVKSVDEFYLSFKLSFQNANINSIPDGADKEEEKKNKKIYDTVLNEFGLNDCFTEFTFSNCTDKEKQLQFIDSYISKLKGTKGYRKEINNIPIRPTLFFYLIINYDDLELIKHVALELLNDISFEKSFLLSTSDGEVDETVPYIISLYIKSTKTLDWLYQNGFKNHFSKSCWLYFKNLQLLKHYQSLVTLNGDKTIFLVSFIIKNQLDNCSKEIIDYIVECGNPQLYEFDNTNIYRIIDQFYNHYGYMVKYKMFKIAYYSYGFSSEPYFNTFHSTLCNLKDSFGYIKFIDWLYENYKHKFELLDDGSSFSDNEINQKLIDNKIQLNNLNFQLSNYTLCSSFTTNLYLAVFDNENIKLLDWLLDLLFSQENNVYPLHQIIDFFTRKSHFNLEELLLGTVKNGNLKSLEFIFQKYNFILLKKSNTNNGLFDHKKLNNLLFLSLNYDHLEQSEFLFNLFTISKDEFYSNAGPLSSIYFKSKFN